MSNEDFELDYEADDEIATITITNEKGEDVEFYVIDEIEHEDSRYLLVVEATQIEDEEADAVVLKEVSMDDENVVYEELDDDEFKVIADILSRRLDDYEIDF